MNLKLVDDREMLIPGEHASVRLTLLSGMILSQAQPFTIRENNVTVGTGCITRILPFLSLPIHNNLSSLPDTPITP